MDKFERSRKSYSQDKPETGSYGVEIEYGDDDKLKARIKKHPDTTKEKFKKNDNDYRKSKTRKTAISDLAEVWWREMGLEKILTDEDMTGAFNIPNSFISYLNKLERAEKVGDFINDLDELALKIKRIIPQLETKQVEMADNLSDYQETEDKILNGELKSMLTRRLDILKDKVDNGQQVLNFIEQKRNEIAS